MSTLTAQRPRYMQIAQTLLSDIQTGAYPVDSLLPTEAQLCEQFGVSRFTAREAIQQLARLGLVTRQAGVGTRVVSKKSANVFRQVIESLDDLQNYSAGTQLNVLNRELVEITDPALIEKLGAQPGQRWLLLNCIRWASLPEPTRICYTQIYIHPAFRSVSGLGGRSKRSVYSLLEEQFGERIVEVQQQVSAGSLSPQIADLLGGRADAACLIVERTYVNQRDEPVELTISTHPSDRYQHNQTFRRDY